MNALVLAALAPTSVLKFYRNQTDLILFDVVLAPNLPKSASLPVATVQQTKYRIRDGRWNFDYVFFTESDQVGLVAPPPLLSVPLPCPRSWSSSDFDDQEPRGALPSTRR